jgi:hypothetical protein
MLRLCQAPSLPLRATRNYLEPAAARQPEGRMHAEDRRCSCAWRLPSATPTDAAQTKSDKTMKTVDFSRNRH